jgi:YkoY family integral membrane protein
LFSQTFELHDIFVILVLVVLEGVLSIDNALVLGLLARRLPAEQRGKALGYGLVGALVFRVVAIFLAGWMLRSHFVKLLGGGYLIYLSLRHLLLKPKVMKSKRATDEDPKRRLDEVVPAPSAKFWPTVAAVELTDIAFAVDSILAAVALVADDRMPENGKFHPKLWVIITGGMIGVVLVRAAASMFIKLLDKFPRFETAAYLLVLVIGVKLVADWAFNEPHQPARLNFSSPSSPMFWAFWLLMAACFCVGFLPRKPIPALRRDSVR